MKRSGLLSARVTPRHAAATSTIASCRAWLRN